MSVSVTVVIPIRNRPDLIDACLRSLYELASPPKDLEIIVVDDASTDDTSSAVERWSGRLPLRLIRNRQRAGPGGARNIGAREASGDILAFIDGDCRAHPRWLADLLPSFADPGVVAVGGGLVSANERTWIQRYESVSHPSQRGPVARDVRPGSSNDFLPGCNILVRRDTFHAIGGFDTTHDLGEDVDLTWRLATDAGRVVYRPDGVVAHEHLDRLSRLLRRRFDLGTSHAILVRRHPSSRRSFVVSLPQLIAVGAALAAFWRPWVVSIAVAALLLDLVIGYRLTGRTAPFSRVTLACIKGHASVSLRGLSLIDQYYFLPLYVFGVVAGLTIWPPLLMIPLALISNSVALSLVERLRLRAGLHVVRFVVVRTLDRLALHIGIIAGCFMHGTVLPIRMRIRIAPVTLLLLRLGHPGGWIEDEPLFRLAAGHERK